MELCSGWLILVQLQVWPDRSTQSLPHWEQVNLTLVCPSGFRPSSSVSLPHPAVQASFQTWRGLLAPSDSMLIVLRLQPPGMTKHLSKFGGEVGG